MHDMIIRGGKIVDGTGAPAYSADIAVSGGVIVEIGKIDSLARETIDADGATVMPGFIDIHTHYDGQFIWDDELEPSFSNGVTTAIAGNCGVGFAPASKEFRSQLVELMEGVEDIPAVVLDEGLDWRWTTFPDYLGRLAEKSYTMDVGTMLPQAPLRVFAMGDRALAHEQATGDDIEKMQHIVREAMMAGALGISGSRILEHLTLNGEHVPGTFAVEAELLALARAMGETDKGVFQMIPLGAAGNSVGTAVSLAARLEEHARIERLAEVSGRPVTYLLHSYEHAPDEWRQMVACSERANARGLQIMPQVAARGLGILLSLDGLHVFKHRPTYLEIAHLPRAERAQAMREPRRRRAILSESDIPPEGAAAKRTQLMIELFGSALDRFYVLDAALDYEPGDDRRLARIAEASGATMTEAFYDTISAGAGDQMLADFVMNYVGQGLDSVYEMLRHPDTVSGLGDAGAHLSMVCDAAMPTFHLSFWSRDRSRGPTLPLETCVHKLTGKPAQLFGLGDRGEIRTGLRADFNVVDLDTVGATMPEMFFDLPMGSGRLLQRGKGYLTTIVNGTTTRRHDAATGMRPGRLVRSVAAG
jgi:N-acyl-D-amino-acid deacylase